MTGRGRGEAAEDGRRDGGDGRDHGRQARYASHALVSPLDLGLPAAHDPHSSSRT